MGETVIKTFLGKYESSINESVNKLVSESIVSRIWEKDYTVWSESPDEVSNRLDWLISHEETLNKIDEINSFVEEVKSEGFTHALLLGMGGSSLAPEVFRLSFGVK